MPWQPDFGTMGSTRPDPEEHVSFWEFFFLLLIFVPLIMLWVFTLGDLAKRADISGLAKGLWAVSVVLLPLIGMLVYFLTRPDGPEMVTSPTIKREQAMADSGMDSTIDQLEKLAELHASGTLSAEEFAFAKSKLLEPK
jgi:Short C-terminal domain/Phospholipase_D-nuclease N-terminal